MDWVDFQWKTFNKCKEVGFKVNDLGDSIQNSFERMLNDGAISKSSIKNSIDDVDRQFKDVLLEIEKLRANSISILKHYSE